jgi:hypothetical protein
MGTELQLDSIRGVQPTKIAEYMLNTSQVPQNKNCTNNKNPINCSVRHYKQKVVDKESVLRGLDRRISKHEQKSHSY